MTFKTLKDLEATEWKRNPDEKIEDWVKVKELKQEAIKDYKYLRHWKEQGPIKLLPWITTLDDNLGLDAIMGYIKWKFNITEEDLE